MRLKSLSIRGLHRTLSLDVLFNEDFTLLVGINGCGKTSVLNVIDWLLRPNLEKLAVTKFDSLTLKFSEGRSNYELTATRSPDRMTLSIEGPPKPLAPITVNLLSFVEEEDDNAGEQYRVLSPEKHELPMWELLKSFSKPTVIALDRTVSAESDEVYFEEARKAMVRRRTPARSPMAHVQEVTSSKYAEFRTKAIANDNELKANIVMSALQDPKKAFRGSKITPMTPGEITQLEEKVSTYLSATIKSTDVRKQVRQFFKASRLFTEKQKGQHALVFDFVATQYRQVESLAKAFNDFEENNALAFKSLNDYLIAVNRFFNDSNKELFFNESTGKLAFSSATTSGKARPAKSILYLSSGERQILVLFTFLAFASDPKGVFIVDEPELSLHPKWQSEFMDAFLKLRPEGTQLILATHSPDIVGKFKNNCFSLRGSRQ